MSEEFKPLTEKRLEECRYQWNRDLVRSAVMGLYQAVGRQGTSTLTKAQLELIYWFPVFFEDEEVQR